MPGIFTTKIEGNRGEIRIPSLSVVVARLRQPIVLQRRREVGTPELGCFDLSAAVSYFNEHLWEDPDYDKEIVIFLAKTPVKVRRFSGSTFMKNGASLRIEGVEPEWPQSASPRQISPTSS